MKQKHTILKLMLLLFVFVFFQCEYQEMNMGTETIDEETDFLLKSADSEETAGNNLSYPVIWAEGVAKTLQGQPGMTPVLNGEWWYCWGLEPAEPTDIPLSSLPDPDNELYLDDGIPGQYDETLVPGADWVKAYIQKDVNNVWQAGNEDGSMSPVVVDFIDWGDNLESVDWYTKSQVRTEVVLYKSLAVPMLEYQMRHVSGWGTDEVHGLQVGQDGNVVYGPGTQATVYSHCARLTIQKLLVDRSDPAVTNLVWVPNEGWKESIDYVGDALINSPIFNLPVYEGGDGPGYYAAEINVKGKVIYGYTWNVRKLNDHIVNGGEAAGCYRITFSFDENSGTLLNTFFVDGTTQILVPAEEEVVTTESSDGEINGGATPVIDYENNLTYIDVIIIEKSGGNSGRVK